MTSKSEMLEHVGAAVAGHVRLSDPFLPSRDHFVVRGEYVLRLMSLLHCYALHQAAMGRQERFAEKGKSIKASKRKRMEAPSVMRHDAHIVHTLAFLVCRISMGFWRIT